MKVLHVMYKCVEPKDVHGKLRTVEIMLYACSGSGSVNGECSGNGFALFDIGLFA